MLLMEISVLSSPCRTPPLPQAAADSSLTMARVKLCIPLVSREAIFVPQRLSRQGHSTKAHRFNGGIAPV